MSNKDYKGHNPTAQFTPVATLHDPLDYLDRVLILGTANFPRTDSLKVGMAALVDDEFMAVTALGPGTVTVSRGCADTVPAKHNANALVWFLDTTVVGTDAKEHTAGETNSIKYSPTTIGGGSLNIETSGAIDVVTYNYRFARPYPPGAVRVRNARWYVEQTLSADTGPLSITFTYRDRTLEADKLVDHDAANIGPEAGTTYTAYVYDGAGTLRRTYGGIMTERFDRWGRPIPPTWLYSWDQGMADLGGSEAEVGSLVPGRIKFVATRGGFDSWQGYDIPFKLNTQGYFIKVGQLATLSAQGDNIEANGSYPPPEGMYGAQVAQLAAQPLSDADNESGGPTDGLYVASLHQGVGQETNFYSTLNRNLFEAPYAVLVKRGDDRTAAKLITVAARPSDRLTDAHSIWTRYDWPRGRGATSEYEKRVDPDFTPWVTVGAPLDYLDTTLLIGRTSFTDGVPLSNVQVGQVALVDAEFIRIDARDATTLTIARGCYDTVPTKHGVGARAWFVEAAAGNDPNAYPYTLDSFSQLGSAAEVKMVPAVYGPPLNLKDVPTDRLDMQHRVDRPYAPGEVLVNGLPWHKGCVIAKDQVVQISWAHRNRDTQGATAVDHHGPTRAPEDGQKYRLSITLHLFDASTKTPFAVKVREEFVDGTEFMYTYSMAQTDGYRSGTLLNVCGRVTVGLTLETVRGDLVSWQSYVIPLALPAYACPPGRPPGGGQLPPPGGGGNGDTGDTPGGGGPGDNNGNPDAPGDNGGGNGNGPPPPPDVPPDWPDPVDPPATPDPDDPNPDLAAHWDTNWDRHWDAYTKDNQGN